MNNEIFTFKSSKSNSSAINSTNNNILENKNKRKSDMRTMTIINNSNMDMTYFKEDILKDLKKFERELTDKFNKDDMIIKEEIILLNNNLNQINTKVSELSTLISVDNMIREKVENLDKIKNKMLDDILVNDIKITNIDKYAKEALIKLNSILTETVIYNGLIGPSCKFKTFHEMIDYILNELLMLENYKDKNILDLSTYKKKLDGIMQGIRFQIDGITKTSAQFTLENFNICDKKIKDINNNFSEKFRGIKVGLEENFNYFNNKFEELENKINELKNETILNSNSFNEHMGDFLVVKKDIKRINEILSRNNLTLNKRKSIFNRLDSKDTFEENIKIFNNINKSKIKKKTSSLKSETIEEIKNNNANTNNLNEFQIKNNNNKNIDIINNQKGISGSPKKPIENKKNNETIKIINNSEDKINSKINLKISVNNSNLLGKSYNNEIISIQSSENDAKKIQKISEKNIENTINKNLILRDSEKEKQKQKYSDNNIIKKGKTIPNLFFKKIKNLDSSNSQNSINSQISQKIIDDEKPNNLLIKGKRNKNIFNQKLKKHYEQNNLFNSDFNNYKTINNGSNNTTSDKLLNIKNKIFNNKYKNVMMTLEGAKKMVINKSSNKGKNIYSIETNGKKYPKLNSYERYYSSKPTIGFNLYSPNDEYAEKIKFKNAKVIYLTKSESHKILTKNKITNLLVENKNANSNEFEPSFNFTHYSPLNKFVSIEEKSNQKEKSNKIKENKDNKDNKRDISKKKYQ